MEEDLNISKLEIDLITIEIIWDKILNSRKKIKNFVITPINLLSHGGAPIFSNSWVLSEKSRIKKIRIILIELEENGKLIKRESPQGTLGMREVGYNLAK